MLLGCDLLSSLRIGYQPAWSWPQETPSPHVPELMDFRLLSDWFQAGFRPLCWPREQSKGQQKVSTLEHVRFPEKIYAAKLRLLYILPPRVSTKPQLHQQVEKIARLSTVQRDFLSQHGRRPPEDHSPNPANPPKPTQQKSKPTNSPGKKNEENPLGLASRVEAHHTGELLGLEVLHIFRERLLDVPHVLRATMGQPIDVSYVYSSA